MSPDHIFQLCPGHLEPLLQRLGIAPGKSVQRLQERFGAIHPLPSVLNHSLKAVDHVDCAITVPEAKTGSERGVGELVQPVLGGLADKGGDHIIPQHQVHGLKTLLALLQG